MEFKFDFSGYATRNDLRCSDGRTIRKDAFKHCDGQIVPLVWGHDHKSADAVLGHALLENRRDGVYMYGSFNDTAEGQRAKKLVAHGDIRSLSIFANELEQKGRDVLHGAIREVSLVLAGANPGAYIDNVLTHGYESVGVFWDEEINKIDPEEGVVEHSMNDMDFEDNLVDEDEIDQDNLSHADDEKEPESASGNKTVEDVLATLNDEQQEVVATIIGDILEGTEEKSKEDNKDMAHHNAFESQTQNGAVLTHSMQMDIIELAKESSVGTLQTALKIYKTENEELAHSIDDIETLFPEYKNITPGEPDMITTDQGWISVVLNGVSKSPISRIKTRIVDAKNLETQLRALGYVKGNKKVEMPNVKLLTRSMDPQTVYVKDKLDRDDIVDITDFDIVEYQYKIMRMTLNEEIATAIVIGDGREEGDEYKIQESHIRPIWLDNELYCIHQVVDIEAARKEVQGSDTSKNFGEDYIYAEAIIRDALFAREKYKGSGNLKFLCTPHLLNIMLLARDLNGRRIYSSKNDLAAALNVSDIQTVEQFEGKTRDAKLADGKTETRKLLGLFVNFADYKVGNTKGGEITKFEDFDIDFNRYKYLMETRLSGGLTKILSAIALEEVVAPEVAG